jgi:predicted Rossmann fold flavoprotein
MTPESFDVCIIGGGAAGLMCAIEAGKRGRKVVVIEHTDKLGKKILISGGGRCNFTNIHAQPRNFISRNPHFCTSALARYTPQDFIHLVERHGIAYHEKKLGQLFCDGSSRSIVTMLERECRRAGVTLRVGCALAGASPVEAIEQINEGFRLHTTHGVLICSSLVIATGGPSIPAMGATGFGYDVARRFGIALVPPKPALVPLLTNEALRPFGALSGISLDCEAACGDAIFRENLLFTHRGLSGPAILQVSSYWEPASSTNNIITVNVLPDTDIENFIQEHRYDRTTLMNTLATVLPQRFAETFVLHTMPHLATKQFCQLSRKELSKCFDVLRAWRIVPCGTEGYAKAEVTAGGVDTNELSQKTMESRSVRGLYWIGEVVDVTGWLGGYNFQWAWSSGYVAGQAV